MRHGTWLDRSAGLYVKVARFADLSQKGRHAAAPRRDLTVQAQQKFSREYLPARHWDITVDHLGGVGEVGRILRAPVGLSRPDAELIAILFPVQRPDFLPRVGPRHRPHAILPVGEILRDLRKGSTVGPGSPSAFERGVKASLVDRQNLVTADDKPERHAFRYCDALLSGGKCHTNNVARYAGVVSVASNGAGRRAACAFITHRSTSLRPMFGQPETRAGAAADRRLIGVTGE